MKKTVSPQDQVFWYLQRENVPSLRTNLEVDVVIIGGGMTGLSAAQAFAQKNKKVVLLEAYYCGAGASGKSSGFITPNSEISLSEFINRYGQEGGNAIWRSINAGVESIRKNIKDFSINCDYVEQDSLFVANSPSDIKQLRQEDEYIQKQFNASSFLEKDELKNLLGSDGYYGGVVYKNTFGISAYKYCQAMKTILQNKGVQIFEETPALDFKNHLVTTLHGTVKADHIIVCTDRFIPQFGKLTNEVSQVQNFLMISQTLTPQEIKAIFPGPQVMVWDTELVYNYFRLSGQRLLLGGGTLFHLFDRNEVHNSRYMYKKLSNYFKKQFPEIDIQFEQLWPGLIGASKDIAPIMGFDKNDSSLFYISAVAGLPIGAALGNYCADHIIDKRDDLHDYFSPYRKFLIPGWANQIIGKRLSFALSNYFSLDSY